MRKIAVMIVAAFCGVFLFGRGPGAGERPGRAGGWTELGPQGGDIRGIARNPKSPAELYAVTYSGLVYRSTNNGGSWTRKGAVGVEVDDLAIDSKNPSTIYALASDGLYKSIDKGASFTKLPFGDVNMGGYGGRIAVHPSNPKIIYVAGIYIYDTTNWKTCMAVFKTANGGQSWTVKKLDPTSTSGHTYDVVVSPKNPAFIYACGASYLGNGCQARVFRSTNGGQTWKNITPGFMNPDLYNYAYAIVADPSNAGRVFVAYSRGIAGTSNSGATWENQASPAYMYAYAVAISKSASDTLYAGAEKTLYKSTDGGKNWTALTHGLFGAARKILVQGKILHFASAAGIFKSTNGGEQFAPGHKGVLAADITGFVLHRAVSGALDGGTGTLYAAANGYGIFKSTNGGGAWTKLSEFAGSDWVACLVSPRTDPRRVYVSTYG